MSGSDSDSGSRPEMSGSSSDSGSAHTGGCDEVLSTLELYLDGECPDDIEGTVRAHLGDCPPCLDRADFERRLRALIASKCRDSAPEGLADRILSGLRLRPGSA